MKRKTIIFLAMMIMGSLLMASASLAQAGPGNPFSGQWVAVDSFDGSDIRLTIAGNPAGPLRITWTENYFSICDGEPGIGRGTGNLGAANELYAEIHFRCFTTGFTLDHTATFVYDPVTDTLTDGVDTWYRPGPPRP
jgi:hypothetical protein